MRSFFKKVRKMSMLIIQWAKQPKILKNIIEIVVVSTGFEIPYKVIEFLFNVIF